MGSSLCPTLREPPCHLDDKGDGKREVQGVRFELTDSYETRTST